MPRLGDIQGKIQNAMALFGCKTVQEISERAALPTDKVQGFLSKMEKEGFVDRLPDGSYSLSPRIFGMQEVKKQWGTGIYKFFELIGGVLSLYGLQYSVFAFWTGLVWILVVGIVELAKTRK
jgi:hypothetical protein